VTRGSGGAILWRESSWTAHPGYNVEVKDTVGAGDAFLAALLNALLDGLDDETALNQASRLGAYVATRSGATPAYEAKLVHERPDFSI
jgi:fructokinase